MSERNTGYQFVSTDTEAVESLLISIYEKITGVSVKPASPEKLFIQFVAAVVIQERGLNNYTGNQNIPSRAEGENLDALAELFYVTQRPAAQAAVCTERFHISEAQTTAILIPAGTRVTDASGTLTWETVADAYVSIGETYAEPAGRITVDQGIAPYYAALREVILDKSAYTAETYAVYAAACAKMDAAATEAERVAAYPAVVKAAAALKLVGNTFTDAQSGWYKPAVDFAQASGLMSGVGGGKFAPGVTTTRAMVAQVLYEAEGAPSVEGKTCPLTDVAPGQWYTNAVIWAYNAGVISGRGDGTFCPNDTITRQEMAVMFYGWLSGGESMIVDERIASALADFDDGASVATWAREAVAYCYLAGIMVGNDGHFSPLGSLDRAQLAQVFCSFYEVALNLVLNAAPDAPEQPSMPTQIPTQDLKAA